MDTSAPPRIRWYGSLYFRIGFGFAAFVVGLVTLQALFFNLAARPALRGAPNTIAALVATDLSAALAENPSLDVDDYLKRQYGQFQPIYMVMKTGSIASNRSAPLDDNLRGYIENLLSGQAQRAGADSEAPVPFVTAPVQVDSVLTGLVVLPPAPPPSPVRDIGRLTSIPGTALLVLLTIIAAATIFEPTRRRLSSLRDATRRLGAGDLAARASISGQDEVTELAETFNNMARELAQRDEALRQSERLRRQMLADVSHELKTPLTSMRGYIETLHRQDLSLDQATRGRYFETLERETDRLDRLVKDLLDLARLENEVGELEVRVFAIKRLFEHVVRRHAQEISERSIDARVNVHQAADQIVADPHRIEQVIENVFANALRHVPDGGSIELAARLDGQTCLLSVSDSGSGISAEHVPYVFERFYKIDSARVSGGSGSGSGLGLSIAKAIVERHHGQIGVSSRSGCTVFTVRLPQELDGEREQVSPHLRTYSRHPTPSGLALDLADQSPPSDADD